MFELVEVSKVECVGLHDDAGELFVPCEHPEDAVHQGIYIFFSSQKWGIFLLLINQLVYFWQ